MLANFHTSIITSINLPVYLPIYLPTYLSIYHPICQSIYLDTYLFVCLSVCPSAYYAYAVTLSGDGSERHLQLSAGTYWIGGACTVHVHIPACRVSAARRLEAVNNSFRCFVISFVSHSS